MKNNKKKKKNRPGMAHKTSEKKSHNVQFKRYGGKKSGMSKRKIRQAMNGGPGTPFVLSPEQHIVKHATR